MRDIAAEDEQDDLSGGVNGIEAIADGEEGEEEDEMISEEESNLWNDGELFDDEGG